MRFRTHHGIRLAGRIALALVLLTTACASRHLGRTTTPDQWRATLQGPLEPDTAARLADSPSLDLLLALAVTRSPAVQAERLRWLAALHRYPQETSLEDPMLRAGYQLRDIPPMMDMEEWTLELMQPLPWWQKLWARGRMALVEAEVARLRYEAALRDLIIDVKETWYELFYIDQALPITERVETLLRNQGILAYTELAVGRTALTEAFRAESQAAQLAYDRILLSEQRAAQAERLRSLLNLPPGTPVGRIRTAPLYDAPPAVEPLYERAEQFAEMLRTRGLEIQRAEYETFLGKLARVPDVSIGFETAEMPDGFNPFMLGASMNLPIWEQRNRALIRERQAAEGAARREALQEVNAVRQAVAEAYFRAQLAERLRTLYANVLLPQAEAIMRQAELFFRNEQASFSNLLETTLAYHNFLLAYYRAVADQGQAIGQLERAIGATARSEAAPGPPGAPRAIAGVTTETLPMPPALSGATDGRQP